ncbi:hypothetical protein ACFQMG_34685 [Kitasatospora paranensis]|uniref:Transporter n=2 Tax=Kitasatospora paranensis TaxID=258053 RepID=A0ABW2G7G9_9ACTN
MPIWMAVNAASLQQALDLCSGPNCTRAAAFDRTSRLGHGSTIANYQLNTVVFLPVLLGLFLGVPVLAREYEQRTLVLAWSQDISPLRWLTGKLLVLGGAVTLLAAALAAESQHVAALVRLADRRSLFEGTVFQAGGRLPLTLAPAWLMFGVAAGAVLRRMVSAFAVVLGAFVGGIVLMAQWRPYFQAPLTATTSLRDQTGAEPASGAAVPNTLSLDNGQGASVDSAGHIHPFHEVMGQWCGTIPDDKPGAFLSCLQQHDLVGIQQRFQPAGRLGTFHLIENGLNLTLLVLSLAITWWCVCRARTTT